MNLERLRRIWYGPARCDDRGRCELEPGHVGFHKTGHDIWPDSDGAYWRDIGERLLRGEMPGTATMPWLSFVEMEHALRATRWSDGSVR